MFTRIYHHTTILSGSTLPRKGPAILVCNHISGLDPMLIQAACRRMIVWMMASEYYEIRGLRWFYRRIQAIPVYRSGRDTAATRTALRALHAGKVLGVFPEGRIEPNQQLLPFQTGVAMMAMKTGIDVYPAYLEGTQRGKEMLEAIFRSNRVHISFGPAISFSRSDASKEQLEQQTTRIQKAVSELRSEVRQHTIRQ